MKQNSTVMKVLFALLAALFVLACSVGSLGATATPVTTNTPASTNTPLPTNTPAATNTPLPPPTETPVPDPPTPAPMGSTVQSANFEVKVIAVEKRDRVYPGGTLIYSPADGYMLLDIGVKVGNLTSSALSVKWNDVYVINSNQEWWTPIFGTWKDTSEVLDPLTIGVSEVAIDPEAEISVSHDGYLRMFFHVPKGVTYYFGFSDSPLTEIDFK